jgi:hypothetical protein
MNRQAGRDAQCTQFAEAYLFAHSGRAYRDGTDTTLPFRQGSIHLFLLESGIFLFILFFLCPLAFVVFCPALFSCWERNCTASAIKRH